MPVVSFPNVAVPARFDEQPWTQVRVEEASTRTGPWETVETVTLTNVDTNAALPVNRSITTVAATVTQGFYRLVWIDADDNEWPSDPIPWPLVTDFTPTLEDIAALLHARTNVMGVEVGTFNDDTRPTGEQVESLITMAVKDFESRVGQYVPADHADEARRLVALQTATLVEASFFPNQLDSDRSAYRQYQAMYLNGVQALGMVGRTATGVSPYVYAT